MKIFVVNGSPKGELSITLQYVRFLAKHRKNLHFEEMHLAQKIRHFERDATALAATIQTMGEADIVLWSFPVYYFLVPADLKRFIELLFNHEAGSALKGKVCSKISTSIHFFDHTAHAYMRAISEDLGMRVLPGFSARMDNLMNPGVQKSLLGFIDELSDLALDADLSVPRAYAPLVHRPKAYRPRRIKPSPPKAQGKVVLVTDNGTAKLRAMQKVFCAQLGQELAIVELDQLRMDSACIGCLRCAWSGECIFHDEVAQAWETLLEADALIFAGATQDRFLSARWKTFLDRSFFHGHRPVLAGRHAVWLIDGPLGQLATLRDVLEGHASVAGMQLFDLIDGEADSMQALTRLLEDSAKRFSQGISNPVRRPRLFPGVAGMKLFRDFVYLTSGIFQEDHRYYQQHGIYDFSQREWKSRFINAAMSAAMHLPPIRQRMLKNMRHLMLRPYLRAVERSRP